MKKQSSENWMFDLSNLVASHIPNLTWNNCNNFDYGIDRYRDIYDLSMQDATQIKRADAYIAEWHNNTEHLLKMDL